METSTRNRSRTAPICRGRGGSSRLYTVASLYPQLPSAHFLRALWIRPASFDPELSERSRTARVYQEAWEQVNFASGLDAASSSVSSSGGCLFFGTSQPNRGQQQRSAVEGES